MPKLTKVHKVTNRPFMHYWGLLSNVVLATAFAVLASQGSQLQLGSVLALLLIFEIGNFLHVAKTNIWAIIAALIPFCSGLGSLLLCLKFLGIFNPTTVMFFVLFSIGPPTLFATAFACGAILSAKETYFMLKNHHPAHLSGVKMLASTIGCLVVLTTLLLPTLNISLVAPYASQLLAIGSFVSLVIGIIAFHQKGYDFI